MGGVFQQNSGLGKLAIGATVGIPNAIFGSKIDPGGSLLGLYGKHYATPIDPLTSTGIHGWDTTQQAAAGAAGATVPRTRKTLTEGDMQALTAQRLLGADQTPKVSTAKYLLGE